MKPKYEVGQWVRFYRNAELVVGVIQYVNERKSWETFQEYSTDKGVVSEDMILEVR